MALITNLVLGLTTGVTVLLGQYLGSKSYRDLSKTIGGAIVLFLIFALGLTFVMLSFNKGVLLSPKPLNMLLTTLYPTIKIIPAEQILK